MRKKKFGASTVTFLGSSCLVVVTLADNLLRYLLLCMQSNFCLLKSYVVLGCG